MRVSVVAGSLTSAYFLGTIHDELKMFSQFIYSADDRVAEKHLGIDQNKIKSKIKGVSGWKYDIYNADIYMNNQDFYIGGKFKGSFVEVSIQTFDLDDSSSKYQKLSRVNVSLSPMEDKLVRD